MYMYMYMSIQYMYDTYCTCIVDTYTCRLSVEHVLLLPVARGWNGIVLSVWNKYIEN